MGMWQAFSGVRRYRRLARRLAQQHLVLTRHAALVALRIIYGVSLRVYGAFLSAVRKMGVMAEKKSNKALNNCNVSLALRLFAVMVVYCTVHLVSRAPPYRYDTSTWNFPVRIFNLGINGAFLPTKWLLQPSRAATGTVLCGKVQFNKFTQQ